MSAYLYLMKMNSFKRLTENWIAQARFNFVCAGKERFSTNYVDVNSSL